MHTIQGKSLRTYSSPVAPLLFSNALPSGSDRPTILSLIADAEEALRAFDQQTATVRAKFAQYLDFHRSLLTPIRLLPEDVLLKIFEHGCVEARSTALDLNSMPWLLTRVCSHWRSLVRSTPTLWRFFRVVDRDCYRYKESRQLEIVGEFLRLSGQCPLHISMESADVPFLDILISQGMRWHTATIPLMSYMLDDLPPAANFPLLRTVTIMDEPDEDSDDLTSEVDVFQHAPLLTAATIRTESRSMFKFHALTHLTVLCLGNNWGDVVRQLNAVASTLTHCTLSFDDQQGILGLPPSTDATLPHLLSLTVREPKDFDVSNKDYSHFLGHLTLPSLTSFAFHAFSHYHSIAEAVVSLIRRSQCSLTSLEVNSREVTPILNLTSRLTHLTVTSRTIANGNLNCLVCSNTSSPLVPKLEVLTLDVRPLEFEYHSTAEIISKYVNLIVNIIESRRLDDVQTLKGGINCLRVVRFLSPEHGNDSLIQNVTARLKKEQEEGLIIEHVSSEVDVDEAYLSAGPSEEEDSSSWTSDSDSNW
ncbi:uncharacterized protein BT62DRAFT_932946 [Guyanagaster necrorhizus]|uniref:F-box domain-containing protein n=1 Tax=Guyanagaster necrorhizus TaxID=856835 RepID=A0A9P7VRW3_9AGAR|nr:uncharacterized protein BT62DRAFT_932946 [Guyanagaster necrorhizus MCA 3950]KAG7445779.1 hypothetical protein BT62DRAFT_932946 [Guyanagaster necrorhizus MCA 3950]